MRAVLDGPFAVLIAYCAAVACLALFARRERAALVRHAHALARHTRRLCTRKRVPRAVAPRGLVPRGAFGDEDPPNLLNDDTLASDVLDFARRTGWQLTPTTERIIRAVYAADPPRVGRPSYHDAKRAAIDLSVAVAAQFAAYPVRYATGVVDEVEFRLARRRRLMGDRWGAFVERERRRAFGHLDVVVEDAERRLFGPPAGWRPLGWIDPDEAAVVTHVVDNGPDRIVYVADVDTQLPAWLFDGSHRVDWLDDRADEAERFYLNTLTPAVESKLPTGNLGHLDGIPVPRLVE